MNASERPIAVALPLPGKLRSSGETIITLKLTRRDIAFYSSVSRETAIRLLDRFIKEGEGEIIKSGDILIRHSFYEKKTTFL
jgi:CRP-like cAMP-binding protein